MGQNDQDKMVKQFLNYEKKAEEGDVFSQYELANCYKDGLGTYKNTERAVYWYEIAANQGHRSAQYMLSKLKSSLIEQKSVISTNNQGDANFERAKRDARTGFRIAQYELALLYESGSKVSKDYKQAFYWCQRSAEQGYSVAQYKLALYFELGIGVSPNTEMALFWCNRAAEQGNENARNKLRYLRLNKDFNNSDENDRIYKSYYEKGYCYEEGIGVKIDKNLAITFYSIAAKAGYKPAIDSLNRIKQSLSCEQCSRKEDSQAIGITNSHGDKGVTATHSKALTVVNDFFTGINSNDRREKQEKTMNLEETEMNNNTIKKLLQIQLYLNIHPLCDKEANYKMEYMALLETILKEFKKKEKWKNSLLALYRKKLVTDLDAYNKYLKRYKVAKRCKIKENWLLTDCLFIGAFLNKNYGLKILYEFLRVIRVNNKKDEFDYIYKAFYSADNILDFEKHYPDLLPVYNIIWHNRQFLNKPEKRIMITANMSAGKSTLLNALTGKKVNKMQNDVCTAKKHFLYNKAGEDGFNYELDFDLELDATEEILMTDNENNKSVEICVGTRFFTITDLDQRVCFIDTPGANSSLDKVHRTITEEEITTECCDILIYLLNAENIGTDDDLRHLRFVKNNFNGKIIFLVNKLDHFKKGVDSVKETITAVKKDLKEIGFKDIEIYPISAYAAFLAKRSFLGEMLNDEETDELNFLVRKLNREEFKYNKYFKTQIDETKLDKTKSIDLQQLLIHSGIISLEKLLYND